MNNNSGFTLVELLIAIAILGILVSFAVPNFSILLKDTRQVTLYNDISRTLRYARSEAIKRSTGVTVCPLQSASSCGTDWSAGLLVFEDPATGGTTLTYDGTDSTLRSVELPDTGIQMTARALIDSNTLPQTATAVRFNGRGQPNWITGTILLCDERGASDAKALVMTGSGIVRQSYSSSGSSGVVLDALGNEVTC